MTKLLEKVSKSLHVDEAFRKGSNLFAGLSFGRLFFGLLMGLAIIAFAGDLTGTVSSVLDARIAEERSKVVLQLNEYTQARFAAHRAKEDSLSLAVEAADSLHGELVAALAIRTKPDTVYIPVAPVETHTDTTSQTRYVSLSDTTDMGIEVTVTAEAPPYPQDLKLGYKVIVPEFRPEIAFIENEEGVFASVSWQNMQFNVEAPFFQPRAAQHQPIRINAGSRLLFTASERIWDIVYGAAWVELEYATPSDWSFQVPIGIANRGMYTGVEVEHTLIKWNSVFDMLWPF